MNGASVQALVLMMETSPITSFEAAKASMGSHFQFKAEKEWQSSSIPVTSKFTLNMKTLAENLATIPFYERQELRKDFFSAEELSEMVKETELYSNQLKQNNKSESITKPRIEEDKFEPPLNECHPVSSMENEIESLEIKEISEKQDDLEDWLDSVLDD